MAIGMSVPDNDWMARTLGQVPFVSDVQLPGMLTAKVLRSPHPHARIVRIGTSAAEAAPGVVGVLTAADLPGITYIHKGGDLSDREPLARSVVRFIGEEVAVVAAETAAQAEGALALIDVRYRRLPSVTSVRDALARGAHTLHSRRLGGNIAMRTESEYGNLDIARGATSTSLSGRYLFGRQAHVCMEPTGALASWDAERERLEVWVTTQAPYFVRQELAHVLDLDVAQVVVHEVAVGGGFGARSKICDSEALAAGLSIKTGRPVLLVLDRAEEFATTKSRHAFDIRLETGVDVDGKLTYRDADVTVENGAYNHSGPSVTKSALGLLASLYRTRSVSLRSRLVDTNRHPGGQFRGYGGPQATFALESQMDELAQLIGKDPIAFRIDNVQRAGDTTHAGWKLGTAGLVECLEAVRAASGWDEKVKRGGSGMGIGVAITAHANAVRAYDIANRSDATVQVGPDGDVAVLFGGADAGTGQRTILAQVAAEELGVEPATIRVVMMDTDLTPFDMGAWSSRGTVMSANAVKRAAQDAAAILRERAAQRLQVSVTQVRLTQAGAASGDCVVPLSDLVGEEQLEVTRSFIADSDMPDPATGSGNAAHSYSFAAQVAEVQVDERSGEIKVLRIFSAHDSGTVLNPLKFEGQVTGGVAMGLGAALTEELVYEGGRLVNPAYVNYGLPRAADLPEIEVISVGAPEPSGPYGAKGVGEIGLQPLPAAIANAVAHAVGIRLRDLPLTPDKVLEGIRARDGAPARTYALWRRPGRWYIAGMRAMYPYGLHHVLHRWGTRLSRTGGDPASTVSRITAPQTLQEAVHELSADKHAAPLAGGTDLVPALDQGISAPRTLVDLRLIPGLSGIRESASGSLRIGAGVTLADLLKHAEGERDSVVAEALRTIATPQVRAVATVGGNLCQEKRCWFFRNGFNCYKRGGWTCPCYAVQGDHRFQHAVVDGHRCQAVTPSDLATVFAALDAVVHIAGKKQERVVPLPGLYSGPGEVALAQDEVVSAVELPGRARDRISRFEKQRLFDGDFAIVSACVSLELDDGGAVVDSRIVLGAVAPTPFRAEAVERALRGTVLRPEGIRSAAQAWVGAAHPLERNGWKVDAACAAVERALLRCLPDREGVPLSGTRRL